MISGSTMRFGVRIYSALKEKQELTSYYYHLNRPFVKKMLGAPSNDLAILEMLTFLL